MAENTHLKDVQTDLKKLLELVELRHHEYMQHRASDLEHLDRMELTIGNIQQSNPNSGLNSTNFTGLSPFQVRNIKLDFPRFDGSDVLQWIFKVGNFFDYYKTLMSNASPSLLLI